MKLKEWRETAKITQEKLADELNRAARLPKAKYLQQESISQWESGTMPRVRWLKVLVKITDGQVTANDFI